MAISELTRRKFLQRAAACAMVGSIMPDAIASTKQLRPLRRIGVQLYTLRKPMAEDFAGTLLKVANIGYQEVEFAGYYDHSPQAVAELLDQYGLTAPAAHVPLEQVTDNLEQLLNDARIINHQYLVVPWLAPEQRQTMAQYQALAEALNRAGEQCFDAGIQLCYHNHDFEFVPIDGRLPYDLLLEATDPVLVAMELDLYWIIRAGANPYNYFSRYPDRFSLCHVKDVAVDGAMADVGAGTMDFAKILHAAKKAGVQHYFVEHDQPADPLGSVTASYQAMAKLKI